VDKAKASSGCDDDVSYRAHAASVVSRVASGVRRANSASAY
jgi:hypothetical protein